MSGSRSPHGVPNRRRYRTVVAGLAIVAMTVGCGSDDSPATTGTPTSEPATPPSSATPTTDATPTTAATTTEQPATTEPPATTADVNVYWAWTIPTHYGTPERLGAGGRTVAVTVDGDPAALATAAIEELLAGPNPDEADIGMMTAIPDGTELLGVDVGDGTATVDLDDAFGEPGGTLVELSRLAQVVFTATAVDGIERVQFAIDGSIADPLLSHGVVAGEGLTRDSFAEIRPLILVESPTPGAEVAAEELTVRGESNTFEATVQWSLAEADRAIVEEGFTTATAGMGTWGGFEFPVDLGPFDGQRMVLVVFESSPEDGSQRNLVEVPISVGD